MEKATAVILYKQFQDCQHNNEVCRCISYLACLAVCLPLSVLSTNFHHCLGLSGYHKVAPSMQIDRLGLSDSSSYYSHRQRYR